MLLFISFLLLLFFSSIPPPPSEVSLTRYQDMGLVWESTAGFFTKGYVPQSSHASATRRTHGRFPSLSTATAIATLLVSDHLDGARC
jgi:hypothetical protein